MTETKLTKAQERQLRTNAYADAIAGRPPSERFKDEPVYMASYRRGLERRASL